MRKIGILGGTFDPIHIGHLLLGQWAKEAYELDELWFLPAGAPYFKEKNGVTPSGLRVEMTALAVSGREGMSVCDLEVKREGKTYTFETVEELNMLYPEDRFYFIFGEDCLDSFATWREPERILKGSEIIAATRGSASEVRMLWRKADDLMRRLGGSIHILEFPAIEISSTLIRTRFREGKPIRDLVPEAVERFITEKGLYRS